MRTRVIATSYGRPALDALRAVVSKAKREDAMAPVTVLVPNNIAGIVARRHLALGLEGRGPGVAGLVGSKRITPKYSVARMSAELKSPPG